MLPQNTVHTNIDLSTSWIIKKENTYQLYILLLLWGPRIDKINLPVVCASYALSLCFCSLCATSTGEEKSKKVSLIFPLPRDCTQASVLVAPFVDSASLKHCFNLINAKKFCHGNNWHRGTIWNSVIGLRLHSLVCWFSFS